jgi:CRISPR-associated endonuclease/helicase Cas3
MDPKMPQFADWYHATRSRTPYPWQTRLAQSIAAGEWPSSLSLPTSSGKTTVLDIWAWAVSQGIPGIPLRLYWCVDRQVVVDGVARQAESLRSLLPRLQIATLHGGLDLSDPGVSDPTAPAIITSTVDQLGSRLLFRAYGSSRHVAPIHAALAGNDALLVLDEAHIAAPFASVLESVSRFRRDGLGLPWRVLFLSATPRGEQGFALDENDYAHADLNRRLSAPKRASLVEVARDNLVNTLGDQAKQLRNQGAGVIAIICNRVRVARAVARQLTAHGETCLITGRVRRPDRERILSDFLPRLEAGSRAAGRAPLYVVSTQTIEVGADFDFDGMVTECAAMSALLQRAGRLNRAGELAEAPMVIVYGKGGRDVDPVYGDDLKAAWTWLTERAGKSKNVDLSPMALRGVPSPQEAEPPYPMLGNADLQVLAQTSNDNDIDISPWLHGYQTKAEVSVVWRRDMPKDTDDWPDYVRKLPPVGSEILNLPIWELKDWLESQHESHPVAVWDGDSCKVRTGDNAYLRIGITVVVPSSYGGCDEWGWAPDSHGPVTDLADTEHRLRIHPSLQEEAGDWLAAYNDDEEPIDDETLLDLAGIKPTASWRLVDYPGGVIVVFGAPMPEQVAGVEVGLDEHSRGVADYARAFCHPALPSELADSIHKAALWHDIGKADDRFQVALGAKGTHKIAKSRSRSRAAARQAWTLSGLKPGWRHEIGSAAHLATDDELIRYLVATHHGRGRCWLPATPDPELWDAAGGAGWSDLHARLSERYGRWGLAYLETVVRLADWQRSRFEAEGKA